MDRLNRRRFLRAASGLFLPACFVITRAQDLIQPGPIMRTMKLACSTITDQISSSTTGTVTVGDSANTVYAGTRFAAVGSTTCKVELALSKQGTISGTMTASLYDGDATDPANLLATSDIINVSVLTAAQAWVGFTNLAYTLTASATYWIVLNTSTSWDVSNYIKWTYQNGADTGVRVVTSADASTWNAVSNTQYAKFRLYA